MVAAAACTDDLDQAPHIEDTSETVYADAANYKSVMAKVYASLVLSGQERTDADLSTANRDGTYMRAYINLQEDGTDEVACVWLSGDNCSGLTYLSWDSNDAWVSDFYYRAYYTVALANEFLRNAQDGQIARFSAAEQDAIRSYRAEVRFVRALSYSHLMDCFVELPFVDENDAVGAFVPPVYNRSQMFEYVQAELKDIADNDNGLPATNEYARACKAAAWTLLAKNYLNAEVYTGTPHWSDCITYCRKVLDAGYQLHSDYTLLFNADNHLRTDEIIFALALDNEHTCAYGATTLLVCGSVLGGSTMQPANYGVSSAWSMFRARGAFANLFTYGGSSLVTADSRCKLYTDGQEQYITDEPDKYQTQGYAYEKFTNLTDTRNMAGGSTENGVCTDFPLMRLADVKLMLAESVLRGGEGATMQDALDAVNSLRTRAFGDDSHNLAQSDLTLDLIIDERGRELFLECTRRTDLIRFGLFTTDRYLWEWKGGVAEGRAVDSKYNHYPVPATEMTANPNIKNEGY